jgi:hypothetical protein
MPRLREGDPRAGTYLLGHDATGDGYEVGGGMTLTICVPGTPSKLLAPNKARTVHYMAKAKVSRELRETGRLAALSVLSLFHDATRPIFTGPVVLTETIYWGRGERRVDLSAVPSLCKPLEDGLTDAGVWLDDSQVVTLIVKQQRDPDGFGYVTFEVEVAA